MLDSAKELFAANDLIRAWMGRTIRGRYQQSALGWLWAIFQPVATVAIFTIVFTRFVPVDTGNVPYVVFSYAAVAPWTFFALSLTDMSMSLVQNMNLVTKIYFPREVLPVAAMLARLLDFGISAILLAALILFYQLPLNPTALLFLPLVLVIQVTLILGVGLGSAALNIFYRDVDPLLKLGVQIWFYASPVIYPVTMVPPSFQSIYFLNPMAGIIAGYRAILLHGAAPGPYLLPAAIISSLVFVAGYWFFKRVEPQFADIV